MALLPGFILPVECFLWCQGVEVQLLITPFAVMSGVLPVPVRGSAEFVAAQDRASFLASLSRYVESFRGEEIALMSRLRIISPVSPRRLLYNLQLLHVRRVLCAFREAIRLCRLELSDVEFEELKASFSSAEIIDEVWLVDIVYEGDILALSANNSVSIGLFVRYLA